MGGFWSHWSKVLAVFRWSYRFFSCRPSQRTLSGGSDRCRQRLYSVRSSGRSGSGRDYPVAHATRTFPRRRVDSRGAVSPDDAQRMLDPRRAGSAPPKPVQRPSARTDLDGRILDA